jgi:hypothetical protein
VSPSEIAAASRTAQGLPERIEDAAALARVAILLTASNAEIGVRDAA